MKNVLTTDLATLIPVVTAEGNFQMLEPMPAAAFGGGTRIVWRSDGTGDATTWLEVVALIAGRPSIEIFVDEILVVLSVTPGDWDVFGAWFSSPRILAPLTGIAIEDGATLRNCAGADGGMQFDCRQTAAPCFAFDIPALVPVVNFFLRNGASILNSGSVPGIEAGSGDTPGSFFLLNLATGGAFDPNPAVPVLNVTSALLFLVVEESIVETPVGLNTISSDALSAIGVVQDGTLRASKTDWPLFLGTLANSSYALDGGQGPSDFRPTNIGIADVPTGCVFYDTTDRRNLFWDGLTWQTQDVVGIVPGKRSDQSVNSARVDNVYSTEPILRTQSAGNVAGGFNGGGTGNKSILGFRPSFAGLPLAIVDTLSWTWTDLINAGISPPYMNLILDLNGDGSAFAIGVIDPNGAPGLGMGGATFNLDGSVTWTWSASGGANMMIVNGLLTTPNPPGGPGFVPPTVTLPGPPLPVGWQNNSYSPAAIFAAYPACLVNIGDTLDSGLPKSPNISLPFLLIAGDSGNQRQLAFQVKRILLNNVPI